MQYYGSETVSLSDILWIFLFSGTTLRILAAFSAILLMQMTMLLLHPCPIQVDDKLYIYLEYVSGGSIYKLLQEYGQFGENAIRNYTQQILSGLAYLHAKNTVHR